MSNKQKILLRTEWTQVEKEVTFWFDCLYGDVWCAVPGNSVAMAFGYIYWICI